MIIIYLIGLIASVMGGGYLFGKNGWWEEESAIFFLVIGCIFWPIAAPITLLALLAFYFARLGAKE